jgi:hypothetical protein
MRSYLSRDRTRMVCEFEADDRVWSAELYAREQAPAPG